MRIDKVPAGTIGLGAIAYALHRIGWEVGLYQSFAWYQMITHFVSGVAVAMVLSLVARELYLGGKFVLRSSIGMLILWEVSEFLVDRSGMVWHGPCDMALDMIVSILGFLLVVSIQSYDSRSS